MKQNTAFRRSFIFIALLALMMVSCSGVSDLPNLFATETPTPTNTFTPSPTFTVTPSPTATLTATATPMPTGTSFEEQSNGSTLFTDYDNRYQLILPADWFVIPLNKDDLSAALDKLAEDNPDLIASAETFKDMDSDVLRLAALNMDRKYFAGGYASNMTVTAIQDATLSAMPLSFITGVLEETFQQQGLQVLTNDVNTIDNANSVEIEHIDVEQEVATVSNKGSWYFEQRIN